MLASRLPRVILRSTLSPRQHPRLFSSARGTATMATPHRIQVQPADTGILKFNQDEAAASKVSDLLQQDLEKHHVFFNAEGFHNHVSHHLLSLYGTGATPGVLQQAFTYNATYQLPAKQPKSAVVEELHSGFAANAPRYLGKGKHYADFLRFFQDELEGKDWRDVLAQYLFRDDGDPTATDLFARLYAGFLHPMIQLMFGVEWQQPALIAEALAQTAVHENKLGDFFAQAEQRAQSHAEYGALLVDLMDEVRTGEQHRKLATSVRWEDPNRIYDGVMKRAPEEAIDFVSRLRVKPDDLAERTAEMVHTAAYVAAAASWHPPHIPKFDFFLIHHLTSAPIFLTLNAQPWIPTATKVRLLEWKMRLDIIQYIGRGVPPLSTDILRTYAPPQAQQQASEPRDLLPRFHAIGDDDGHIIKVVRALLIAQEETRRYGDGDSKRWVRIREEDWLRVHYLLLRGVEGQSAKWVRTAGFDEAWADVPKAENARL